MKRILVFSIALISITGWAQQKVDLNDVEPGQFDQGKMWTFENPPLEYFREEYGLDADKEWMDDARKSALRFASWCSASFISSNGLILTNHHCSRGVVASVMKEGENFDDNGFYAAELGLERKVPDLYVDQMVMVKDITAEVKAMSGIDPDSAISAIEAKYSETPEWEGLVIESRTFYSGGKYSLYGFKRYNDIRLVLYPELAMGYFGGDPDNFTYPRYNLDFSLFRAYDDNGQPLEPSNYFEFNEDGAAEDEAVFVIGNPGSTGRYLTMAQLYFQRDISAPAIVSFLENRKDILLSAAEEIDDVYEKDSVTNLAFSLSNSEKAYAGRLAGLNDPVLMTKKQKKEEQVRANSTVEGPDPWDEIQQNIQEGGKFYPEVLFLSPNETRGKINMLLHMLYSYESALDSKMEDQVADLQAEMRKMLKGFDLPLERALFAAQLEELDQFSRLDYIDQLLAGKEPFERARELLENSILVNDPDKFFKMKMNKIGNEPLLEISKTLVPNFRQAATTYQQANVKNPPLQEKIMNLSFGISGLSSPPDATFSLRIADGRVKGYEYNGTVAPTFTTYFGLYDRYYSHNKEYPWNLPKRWLDPPMELLKAPLNFVCTADIIGGNSGSPVINKNQEVVGLVFDGNIESLPGFFIFDETSNRTVSVHAGGIAAALRYIYKADRLLEELE